MRFIQTLRAAWLVCFALLPLVTQAAPIDEEVLPTLKRVGAISYAADELVQQHMGVMVFGNEKEAHDISDWGIDEIWQQQMVDAAKALNQFEVISLAVDQKRLAPFYGQEFVRSALGTNPWGRISDVLLELGEANDLDAILILVSHTAPDPRGSNQRIGRFSLVTRGGLNDRGRMRDLILNGRLFLLDAKTGKELGSKVLRRHRSMRHDSDGYNSTTIRVDWEIARKPLPQWTNAERSHVMDKASEITKNTWDFTLRRLLTLPRNW